MYSGSEWKTSMFSKHPVIAS